MDDNNTRDQMTPPPGLGGREIDAWVKAEVLRREASKLEIQRQAQVEYKSQARDTQESLKESSKELAKEISNECAKSAPRDSVQGPEWWRTARGAVVPKSLERMILGIQGAKTRLMLMNLRKTAGGMKLFRLRFELARLLKQAKSEKADEGSVWDLATDLGVPFGDILEIADKVKRLPSADAFEEAAGLSRELIPEVMHLDPPLRRLATMAWHLQRLVGKEDIYLPQRKVAEKFRIDQSVIQRQIKLLIRAGWLEEVRREQKGQKTYVWYQCRAAASPEG